ncbi:MAG: glycosyl hydrolase 53 family protein [Anaerolineae bacterium]
MVPKRILLWAFLTLVLSASVVGLAQSSEPPFYFGVDLSYVNEVEDCGAVFRENGEARDPFALFAEHGANLVRARLWYNPDWTQYSTLEDVKRTFRRARDAGMETLLDIHYSDTWADAGTQQIPPAWQGLSVPELADAVYQYTTDVLNDLEAEALVPAFVQIGNETNSGILKRGADQDWVGDAQLFNAGIRAVRDFTAETGHSIKILLHVAQPENTLWWFTQAEAAGITDFDVIGVSYYPQWSTFSIGDMGAQVTTLRQRFNKDVMILETGYGWTRDSAGDTADNVLDQGLRGYSFSPEGQHRFMDDVTQSLISNGALGVVYWEPAWVSTGCWTRWGQGSHWENATFFDFNNRNEVLEGINFLSDPYLYPLTLPDGEIDAAYGDPLVQDSEGDALRALDLIDLYAVMDDDWLHVAFTAAGDVLSREGSYLLYIDTTHDTEGATVDVGRRPITVAEPYEPEFRLDVAIREDRGSMIGGYTLSAWTGSEWENRTFTGGAAVHNGAPSIIELAIPRALLAHPQTLNLALISTDRGRARSASDIMGASFDLEPFAEGLVLDQFFSLQQ